MNCIQRLDEKNLRGLKKYVNFSTVGAAFDHTVHHVHHPRGALTTGGTLTTRLVFVELGNSSTGERE